MVGLKYVVSAVIASSLRWQINNNAVFNFVV